MSAAISVLLYFWHFKFAKTGGVGLSALLRHPIQDGLFLLTTLGGFALGWGGAVVAQVLGLGMLTLGVTVLVLYVNSDHTLAKAVPAVLVIFTFLFDLGVLDGRSGGSGYGFALQSRYVTYNLLIFVAAYLTMIERWDALALIRRFRPSFVSVAGGLAILLVAVSATTAVTRGETLAAQLRSSRSVLVNYQTSSDTQIAKTLTLAPPESNIIEVRTLAPFLADEHDSVFGNRPLVASLTVDPPAPRLLPSSYLLPVLPSMGPSMGSLTMRRAWEVLSHRAWDVLSIAFGKHPSLQRSMPMTATELDQEVLGAVTHGSVPPTTAFLPSVQPELPLLKALYRIAFRT